MRVVIPSPGAGHAKGVELLFSLFAGRLAKPSPFPALLEAHSEEAKKDMAAVRGTSAKGTTERPKQQKTKLKEQELEARPVVSATAELMIPVVPMQAAKVAEGTTIAKVDDPAAMGKTSRVVAETEEGEGTHRKSHAVSQALSRTEEIAAPQTVISSAQADQSLAGKGSGGWESKQVTRSNVLVLPENKKPDKARVPDGVAEPQGSESSLEAVASDGQGDAPARWLNPRVALETSAGAVTPVLVNLMNSFADGSSPRAGDSKKASSSNSQENAIPDLRGDVRLGQPAPQSDSTPLRLQMSKDSTRAQEDDSQGAHNDGKIKAAAKPSPASVKILAGPSSLATARVSHASPEFVALPKDAIPSWVPAERGMRAVQGFDAGGVQPPTAFHSLRLTEHMAGPELRFTWHSPESGDIQLSTSLHHRDVQVMVNTERTETAVAMRAELPSLDNRLHEHSLRLGDVNIVAQERSISTGLGMTGQERGQRDWKGTVPTIASPEESAGNEMRIESIAGMAGNGRVSVLA